MSGIELVSWWGYAYRSKAAGCAHCGVELPIQPHQGQARRWCSNACRMRTYRKSKAITAIHQGSQR